MSVLQKIAATVLIVVLALLAYGLWSTHPSSAVSRGSAKAATQADALPEVDQSTLATAQRLAQLATSTEERALAQDAVQAADHELDIAFAAALRRIEAHPPVLGPAARRS